MRDDIKLPPQPEPQILRTVMPDDHRYGHIYGFTRRDLVQYARAAVIADREGRQQWISVNERMPDPTVWVLVHNERWTGVGTWIAGDHLHDSERWQDEHAEFIEHLGPKITHWQPLPTPPADAQRSGDTDV